MYNRNNINKLFRLVQILQVVILVNRCLHVFLITSAIACIVSKSTGPLPFPDKGTTCLVSKWLALNGALGSHLSFDSKWNGIQSSLSENTYKSELSSRLILKQHRIRKANTPLGEKKKKHATLQYLESHLNFSTISCLWDYSILPWSQMTTFAFSKH